MPTKSRSPRIWKYRHEERNRHWLIKDNAYKQAYSIRSTEGKLHVYQQSKFEILTFLFETDSVYESSLAGGKLTGEINPRIRCGKPAFIPTTHRYPPTKDGEGWTISSPPLKYNILSENNRLKVYLNLDSKWLRVKVDDETQGWVQSARVAQFSRHRHRQLVHVNKPKNVCWSL